MKRIKPKQEALYVLHYPGIAASKGPYTLSGLKSALGHQHMKGVNFLVTVYEPVKIGWPISSFISLGGEIDKQSGGQ